MKSVYIATSNRNKAELIGRELSKRGIRAVHFRLDIPEPRSYDMREIAVAKCRYAYSKIKKPCIVLDSGFFVPAIGGFPRTFVHFALDTVGVDGILKLAAGKDRGCEFRDCLAYWDGRTKEPVCFQSTIRGTLAEKQRGRSQRHHWSALFKVFIPKGSSRTLAEMSEAEFWKWSQGPGTQLVYLKKFAVWFAKER